MKLFGMVLLAGFISLICGVAVTSAASSIMPCYSDKAGCGMGEAYRLLFVPAYVLLAMVGLGITVPGKNRERALKLAMYVLILMAVFVIVLGLASDANSGRTSSSADLIDAAQMSASYCVVVIVQWLMLRRYLRLREAEREAVS